MKRPAVRLDRARMTGASSRAQADVDRLQQLASDIHTDARRAERLAKQECPACFYFSRLGGAACTTQPCAACGVDQNYGSTNTDALCKPCAVEHDLCKHCGGDLRMRERRRLWPDFYGEREGAALPGL